MSCSKRDSSDYMAFDDVRFINKFPKTFPLRGEIKANIDVIGIKDFCFFDSLIFISTNNNDSLWTLASLTDYHTIGAMFKKGIGPSEFISSPDVDFNTQILQEKDQLYAYIYDSKRGKLLKVNITESINRNNLILSKLNDSLPVSLFNFVYINDSTYFCKEAGSNNTQQLRYINGHNNKKIIPDCIGELNKASIKKGEDINILSTLTKFNQKKKLVIEMPIGLNYINIYSLDKSFSRTICIGKKLYSIKQIQEKERWDRIYTFGDLRIYKNFWAVLYINESEKVFQTKREKNPFILIFDWDGNPMAKFELNQFATSFDIDFKNGYLYIFDTQTETFFKYDINNILSKSMI